MLHGAKRMVRAALGADVWESLKRASYKKDLSRLEALGAFRPNSSGSPSMLLDLAVQDAGTFFPVLSEVMELCGRQPLAITDSPNFPETADEKACGQRLYNLFNKYGSDKSIRHDYHHVYGTLIARLRDVSCLLEIGLGTNNEDVASNMTHKGHPGASLRAFSELLPKAVIFGADIDKRVLFEEGNIQTFFVDQLDLSTFDAVNEALPCKIDLLIDDGLHSPAANLAVLKFGLRNVRPGGWIVIEDISAAAVPAWQSLTPILEGRCDCELVCAQDGFMFLARVR